MGIRDLLKSSDQLTLDRIAVALERIADNLEGKTPPETLPDPTPEPLAIHYGSHTDIARSWQVEQELRDLLGHDPTPEEIVTIMDGVEWDQRDVDQQIASRAKKLS